MTVEEHRITDEELASQPWPFGTVDALLFNGPVAFGRGVARPGPDDEWEAFREQLTDVTVVRIKRGAVASRT